MPEELENTETPDNCTGDPIDFDDFDGQCFEEPERAEALNPTKIHQTEADGIIKAELLILGQNFIGPDRAAREDIVEEALRQIDAYSLNREEFQQLVEGIVKMIQSNVQYEEFYPNVSDEGDINASIVGDLLHNDMYHYKSKVDRKKIIPHISTLAQRIASKRV
jgi:hypothetical protein